MFPLSGDRNILFFVHLTTIIFYFLQHNKNNNELLLCQICEMGFRATRTAYYVLPVSKKAQTATRTAYYVLRNCRLQGSGNLISILYSAKLLITRIRQPDQHTIFCQRAEKRRQQLGRHTMFCQQAKRRKKQPELHTLFSNAMRLGDCMVHIVMIVWIYRAENVRINAASVFCTRATLRSSLQRQKADK